MEQDTQWTEPYPPDQLEYQTSRIREIAQDLPPGVITEKEIRLGGEMLTDIYLRYGDPDSETYKPYHNDNHSLSVLRRSWRLWGLLQEKLPEKFDDSGYRKLLFASLGHDLFEDKDVDHEKNVADSAQATALFMMQNGYGVEEANEVHDAIVGTAVERDEQGTIVQSKLQDGSKSKIKLVLSIADINGIPMEGIPTMIDNVLDLYMEFSGTSARNLLLNPAGAIGFMLTQAKFLDDRLAALDETFDHYFTSEEKQIVKEAFEQEFTGATRDALGAAKMMQRFPNIAELVVKASVGTKDRVVGGTDVLMSVKEELTRLLRRVRP